MELPAALRGRGRLVRTALAAALGVLTLRSLRKGKRLRGVLAGLGAVALGYTASSEPGEEMDRIVEDLDIGSTSESTDEAELRCAICGEPIVVGQARTPNEDGETVHEACLEAPA